MITQDTSFIAPSLLTKIQNRITVTLFAAQSLYGASTTASFILLPIIAAQLSGSDSAAGIPSTLTLLGRAVIGYPIGWLMDRVGRRTGLSLGYLLAAVGAAIGTMAIGGASFVGFCVGAFFAGMGRGVTEQTRFVAAEVHSQAQRARAIGWVVWAGTVGAIGGPLLVDPSSRWAAQWGLLADTGPFVLSVGLALVALLLTFVFLRPEPLTISRALSATQQSTDTPHPARTVSEILHSRQVQLALVAMTVGQLVMTLLMVITPLHMAHHQHAVRTISYVIMAHAVGMFGLSWLTGRLIDHFGQLNMIVAGAGVLILSALLSPVSTGAPMLAFAMFVLGLGWNFCFIAGSSLLSDALMVNERGRVQGTSEALVALASGVGSLGTGAAFDQGGMLAVSVIGLAPSLLLILVTVWWMRRISVAGWHGDRVAG